MKTLHPLQIGPVRLKNNMALAPMAGTSDLAYRSLCFNFGAGLTVTELVSARGICYDQAFKRTWRYIAIDSDAEQVAIQLFGSCPDDFRLALELIFEHPVLSRCSMIDLNMGCPVPKVVKNGDGSALMLAPEKAAAVIRACVETASQMDKPVTVKFRKGWDEMQVNAVDFARMCEQAGAAAITVHGRTRSQMYSGQADWQIIQAVKQAVQTPVFGNGDIVSGLTAWRMLLETGCDGFMVGRAAQGNPWLFTQIALVLEKADQTINVTSDEEKAGPAWQEKIEAVRKIEALIKPVVSVNEKISVIQKHLHGLTTLHGEQTAVKEMRAQIAAYMKGTYHGGRFRAAAMQAETTEQIMAVLEEWRFYCRKYCESS